MTCGLKPFDIVEPPSPSFLLYMGQQCGLSTLDHKIEKCPTVDCFLCRCGPVVHVSEDDVEDMYKGGLLPPPTMSFHYENTILRGRRHAFPNIKSSHHRESRHDGLPQDRSISVLSMEEYVPGGHSIQNITSIDFKDSQFPIYQPEQFLANSTSENTPLPQCIESASS